MGCRVYCSECGFLNDNSNARSKCKACLSQLLSEGVINKLEVTLIHLRTRSSFKELKLNIKLLKQNESVIQKIIHQIKKKGKQYPFQDDETTDLLKQVLKKNLTPEKLALEKNLHHTKLIIGHLCQDLGKNYDKEKTLQNKSSSMSLFKLLEEKEIQLNKSS